MAAHTDEAKVAQSREVLLDVAERLMSQKGYAGTSVSAICKGAGVAATSLYWHFGSKEGLLAAVMERGARRWFAALPRWDQLDGGVQARAETVVRGGAAAVGAHPAFLRVFYMLALEDHDDAAVAELIGRVRQRAADYFRSLIIGMLSDEEPHIAEAAATELTPFAVAYSDGCFFAAKLESADLYRMYTDLLAALRALAPAATDRARREGTGS
ncbi:helix-turn-helix domain-containing protein [Actinophytocola sp.]|uniref:TetR/AcrR family transcriptional regulator n=1 Tax=Actinophytocola sp. TaxID=1872138 RepID=UPI002ED5D9B6